MCLTVIMCTSSEVLIYNLFTSLALAEKGCWQDLNLISADWYFKQIAHMGLFSASGVYFAAHTIAWLGTPLKVFRFLQKDSAYARAFDYQQLLMWTTNIMHLSEIWLLLWITLELIF